MQKTWKTWDCNVSTKKQDMNICVKLMKNGGLFDMKTANWYRHRLAKYIEDHYGRYSDEIEFFPDPDINQSLNLVVVLVCLDSGNVNEFSLF